MPLECRLYYARVNNSLQLLKAITDLQRYAFVSGGHISITEQTQTRLLFQLDRSLMPFFNQRHLDEPYQVLQKTFGPKSTHQVVVELGRQACAAIRQGVQDYRAGSGTPDDRWVDLWDFYMNEYGVSFAFFRIDRTKPSTLTIDVADDGEIVQRVEHDLCYPPPPEYDWHPDAWPSVCARLDALPPVDGCPQSANLARNQYWDEIRQILVGRLESELRELLSLSNRIGTIAAYKQDMQRLDAERLAQAQREGWPPSEHATAEMNEAWAIAERQFDHRRAICRAHHFPGVQASDLRSGDVERGTTPRALDTIDTAAKLWYHITEHILEVRDTVTRGYKLRTQVTASEELVKVYGILNRLGLSQLAPQPPYPAYTEAEATHQLQRIANELEAADVSACTPAEFMPAARAGITQLRDVAEIEREATPPLLPAVVGKESTPMKPKQSTECGDAEAKLIPALTKHHQYANGGCLNLEPIGNNELARAVHD